jgi:NAD(P)-dependent dehydrogenase (short-subunit alcohol dehydrogenase family)
MGADLGGRVALVTGAGRGIGRAVSLALARAGARLVLAARTAAQIDTVAAEIARAGGEALAVPADVSREPDVTALFGRLRDRFQDRLDILVNNAGVGIYGPLDAFRAEDFDRVLAVNLRGTFLCCREALRLMEPRKAGWIINVSSVVGFKGYPNQAAYTASKHGIVGLTKSLAVEAQPHGIRASVVLPGGVDTDLAAAARPDLDRAILLQPEDIAQTVLYLLSLSDRAAVDQIYIRRRTSAPF